MFGNEECQHISKKSPRNHHSLLHSTCVTPHMFLNVLEGKINQKKNFNNILPNNFSIKIDTQKKSI